MWLFCFDNNESWLIFFLNLFLEEFKRNIFSSQNETNFYKMMSNN